MPIYKQLKISFLLLIVAAIFTQCNIDSTSDSYEGIWIGAYQDYAVKFPASLILDLSTPDTVIRVNALEKDTLISKYSVESDSIIFNDTTKLLFQRSADELIFGVPNKGARFYYPPQNAKGLKGSLVDIETLIQTKTWERTIEKEYESLIIKEQYKFLEDKVEKTRNYYLREKLVNTEKEQFCYHLFEYKSVRMLLMYGNINSCDASQYVYMAQITELNKNSFKLYSGVSDFDPTIELKSTAQPISEVANAYYVCNGNRMLQYYNTTRNGVTGSYFPNGNTAILKNYSHIKHESPIWKDENGYIRIRFVINCDGKTGRWSIQESDRNYEPHTFPDELVESLIEHTIALEGWIPRKPVYERNFDDSKYLTYKIKDGKVVEVFP